MCDVLFITPNFSEGMRSEPFGTLLLATLLKNSGISCDILHLDFKVDPFNEFLDRMEQHVIDSKATIISFYTRCDAYHLEIKIAERLKQNHPELYIIFGGPQSDLCAEDTLKLIPWVDYICRGEGESTIVPFFTSLLNRTPDESIDGLAFMRDGKPVINQRPPLLDDLDQLPPVDYSLLKISDEQAKKGKHSFSVDVGRGCPFGCKYCSTKSFWQRHYRLKSAERIIDDIKELHSRFNATSFCFEHDMFTMDKSKVLKICKMIQDLDFKITWYCSARIDCIDEELVDAMVDAGMRHIFVGIETGSPRIQKLVNKNLKLDGIFDILKYISAKNVTVMTSFIYGFPQETEEDVSMTLSLCMKLLDIPNLKVGMHLCTFLPGTELQQEYKDELAKTSYIPNFVGDFGATECADLINAYPSLFSQFYEYPTPMRKKLKFFSTFIDAYKLFRVIYKYIFEKHYAGRPSIQMYYDWAEANQQMLAQYNETADIHHAHDIFQAEDLFLEMFSDDPNYGRMKELSRYIRCTGLSRLKNKKAEDFIEIFNFCLDDYLAGKQLETIGSGMTVSHIFTDSRGKRKVESRIMRG